MRSLQVVIVVRSSQSYIINFNLGTATKVNMILHGDGSTNIFVKDGLLPFSKHEKATGPNALYGSERDPLYESIKHVASGDASHP